MSDYKRNPRSARRARKSLSRKALVVLSLMMVLVLAAVGGTLAWLTATSGPVTNTFTTSDINITLAESPNLDLKMVPGWSIAKDPKVTVSSGSELCWLFVEITESDNFDTFMTYNIATGWTLVDGTNNVYAMKIDDASKMNVAYSVLENDQVTVKDTVTKSMLNALTTTTNPTLTFKAYAVQLMKDNNTEFTAVDAWANRPTT